MNEDEICREIVDAAYQIHKRLGPGLLESVLIRDGIVALSTDLLNRRRAGRNDPIAERRLTRFIDFEETGQ